MTFWKLDFRSGSDCLLKDIVQFQKYSYSSHGRDWSFLGGGSVRPKNLKKCVKLVWNSQRGVWIFCGATHSCCVVVC